MNENSGTADGSEPSSPENPLLHTLLDSALDPLFWAAERQDSVSAWNSHIPFAHWLVKAAKPGIFVELGTHAGVSYSAFCEAVLRAKTGTRCFAVDTWKGDEQAGFYDETIYADFKRFHDGRYRSFSDLLRMTFDEAVTGFADGSIDLLHIDGRHGYEFVVHDFETWLPKLSRRAIVLFHDTNERKEGFGVWRLWAELRSRYPSFEFLHGHGLGVLCVEKQAPTPILALCKIEDVEEIARIRERFQYLGDRWAADKRERWLERDVADKVARFNEDKAAALASARQEADAEKAAAVAAIRQETAAKLAATLVAAQEAAETEKAAAVADMREVTEVEKNNAVNAARREVQAEANSKEKQLRAELDTLRSTASTAKKETETARQELREALAANEAILSSVSWRLSAPIRTFQKLPETFLRLLTRRRQRRSERHDYEVLKESGLFDAAWYLKTYPDVTEAGVDPLLHYLRYGSAEGRNPVSQFDTKWYLAQNPDVAESAQNPLVHFVKYGREEGREFSRSSLQSRKNNSQRPAVRHTPGRREPVASQYIDAPPAPPSRPPVRLIAFYLPQFHPIPENDEWWGPGFTEWTNVAQAVPQFEGHYQPHLPAALGFYDLRIPDVQRRQVELAKSAGLGGFCFYFYWFNGKRLLEHPVRQYFEHAEFDLPFCLCWANENWTRRWDGREQEVLIGQRHSPDDDISFISHIATYLQDRRYIRVGGKPLLVVYQPSLFPDARATAARWREWCRNEGIGEIHLAVPQSFDLCDPAVFGFDTAIEFPPNQWAPRVVTNQITRLNQDYSGVVHDWTSLMERSRNYTMPTYPLWRGICPSWDNEPRRTGQGTVFTNATPAGYREWLTNASLDTIDRFEDPDRRLIFINAWNEWAEGAHLEPDQRYGYAWLQATRDALDDAARASSSRRIVLVSHDAHRHGAQHLALALTRSLVTEFGFAVDVVLLGPGALKAEFEEFATVHDLADFDPAGAEARDLAADLFASGYRLAIVNTTVSGPFLEVLTVAGLRCLSLIHEMAALITERQLELSATAIARNAAIIVFGADVVRESFATVVPLDGQPDVRVRPQGLYKRNRLVNDLATARHRLRVELGIAESARIVLGVGFADHRKGIDLFVEVGLALAAEHSDVHLLWVGNFYESMRTAVTRRLANEANASRIHLIGYKTDTDQYFAGADLFALTSREDPLPTVVFEAMDVALPIVAFAHSGGIPAMIDGTCGIVVPKADVAGFSAAVAELLENRATAVALGAAGKACVDNRLGFGAYVYDLLDYLDAGFLRVSVIVPNYNYARHLKARLASIFEQAYPIFEVIVLDDASTDDSLRVIEAERSKYGRNIRLVVNDSNSGSAFAQWEKGLALARGDYVWIAEADDIASSNFVARLAPALTSSRAALGFTDSYQIDELGRRLGDSYADYCDDGPSGPFHSGFELPGATFLAKHLSVKNTILNVSAVLWRRDALTEAMVSTKDALSAHKVAGDWRLYAEVALRDEPVVYVAEALNGHRRHAQSVTHALDGQQHLEEIAELHCYIAARLGVGDDLRDRMTAYETDIARQFGLEHDPTHAL